MTRATTLRALGAAGAALGLTLAAALPTAAQAGAATPELTTVTLSGGVLPHLDALTDLGATPAATPMQVGVALANPHAAQLAAAYKAITTPGSPDYQRFLTPAQLAASYGVPAATVAATAEALTADGLRVTYTSADGTYLLLRGTAAQMESTFKVGLSQYRVSKDLVIRANAVPATVPSSVATVLGLSDAATSHLAQDTCVAGRCTGTTLPQDLWDVYDQPAGDLGRGQKVAIFGEGQLDSVVTDLRKFETDFGSRDKKTPFPTVPVRRIYVDDDLTSTDGNGEWDLDQAAITGMAPDIAELEYYFGTDLSDASIAGTYSAWVNDPNGALTGNSSFGGCENLNVVLGGVTVDDQLLMQATMEGRTMFVSTGDVGGSCGIGAAGVNGVTNGGQPQVEYPSSSPYVVAVGGTVLYTSTTTATGSTQVVPAARSLEYAWNETGGGTSNAEPQPASQANVSPQLTASQCLYTTSGNPVTGVVPCRGVPDVAAQSGDVITNGYAIVSAGADTESGGTSLSSPLWAGMWARILASHPASGCTSTYTAGSASLGFAQPVLYRIGKDSTVDPGAFFDIGDTNNKSLATGNGQQVPLARSAVDTSGWDYVSGLGTPDVTNIMKDVNCGNLAPTVAVNPTLPADTTTAPVVGCPANGIATDPSGDVSLVGAGPTPQDASVDILKSQLTYAAPTNAITWAVTFGNRAAATKNDLQLDDEFTYGGKSFQLDALVDQTGGAANVYTLQSYTVNATTFAKTTTTLATITGSEVGNVVSMVLPLATFNAKSTPYIIAGSALTGLDVEAFNTTTQLFDSLAYGACPFFVPNGAVAVGDPITPTLPESGLPVLLLVSGTVGACGLVLLRRRRTA